MNEWSDDFEPHVSIKGNHQASWVKVVMLSPPHEELHSLTHTYPIVIGLKGASHEAVENAFANELIELSSSTKNLVFHGGLKSSIQIHIELFASLQDQPE